VALAWIAPSLAAACVAIKATPPATVSPPTATRTRAEMVFMLVPPKNTVATCGVVGRQSVAFSARFGSRLRKFAWTSADTSRAPFDSAEVQAKLLMVGLA
jgi:hypothetical protein